MEPLKKIILDWNSKRIEIDVEGGYTVGDLKYVICKKTRVQPFLQVFINLDLTDTSYDETTTLNQLQLTNEFILLMQEADDISKPSTSSGTCNEGTCPPKPTETTALQPKRKMPLQPLDQFLEQALNRMPMFKNVEKVRKNKNLLVLDIDLTIFDCTEEGRHSGYRAIRPYLQIFLKDAYANYDIIIWSATNRSVIYHKLDLLGITNSNNYKILGIMDISEMVSVSSVETGLNLVQVKSLQTVWNKFYQYSYKNTVICDDQPKNLLLNKDNGVLVSVYSFLDYESDKELLDLSKYLKYLCNFCNFASVDHALWRECI